MNRLRQMIEEHNDKVIDKRVSIIFSATSGQLYEEWKKENQ